MCFCSSCRCHKMRTVSRPSRIRKISDKLIHHIQFIIIVGAWKLLRIVSRRIERCSGGICRIGVCQGVRLHKKIKVYLLQICCLMRITFTEFHSRFSPIPKQGKLSTCMAGGRRFGFTQFWSAWFAWISSFSHKRKKFNQNRCVCWNWCWSLNARMEANYW